MTEGNLVRWTKSEGDTLKAGDVIAEIETDKATMEVESVDAGVLAKILVAAGSASVKVKTPIAVILEEGESGEKLQEFTASLAHSPAVSPKNETSDVTAEVERKSTPHQSVAPASATLSPHPAGQSLQPNAVSNSKGRVKISPLARRIALSQGIDTSKLHGSGPGGRIVRRDVEAAVASSTLSRTHTVGHVPARVPGSLYPSGKSQPVSMVRKVIAQRLTESKQSIPHFYLTIDVEIDRLLAFRQEFLKMIEPDKVSINDFIIRALALALMRVPEANAIWQGDTIDQFDSVDVSVAVAIEGGLVTPIIRDAQAKSVQSISQEMRGLAERARVGKLKPEEFQGGTVTLSNLGMFGVRQFEAIINPPQSCILSVGASEERPVVRANRQIEIATVMTCTLSADHRVVDGAVGARLMAALKFFLSEPLRLLL